MARIVAVLAIALDFAFLAVSRFPFTGLRIESWVYWLLLDVALVPAMAAFHRDAPPTARGRWLLALPADFLFIAVPTLVLQVAYRDGRPLDVPGLCCIMIAAAGLTRVPLAWTGRTGHASPWSLTLLLLAGIALALRMASLASYPGMTTADAVEAVAVVAVGLALYRDAARELRRASPVPAARPGLWRPYRGEDNVPAELAG